MATRQKTGTQAVRVTSSKLEKLRAVLVRHLVPGLASNAPDRALIDAALDIAMVALVDHETMTHLARVRKTVPPVLPLIPFVDQSNGSTLVEVQPHIEVDGEAVFRRLSGSENQEEG